MPVLKNLRQYIVGAAEEFYEFCSAQPHRTPYFIDVLIQVAKQDQEMVSWLNECLKESDPRFNPLWHYKYSAYMIQPPILTEGPSQYDSKILDILRKTINTIQDYQLDHLFCTK
jgi:hypothetical protein